MIDIKSMSDEEIQKECQIFLEIFLKKHSNETECTLITDCKMYTFAGVLHNFLVKLLEEGYFNEKALLEICMNVIAEFKGVD